MHTSIPPKYSLVLRCCQEENSLQQEEIIAVHLTTELVSFCKEYKVTLFPFLYSFFMWHTNANLLLFIF